MATFEQIDAVLKRNYNTHGLVGHVIIGQKADDPSHSWEYIDASTSSLYVSEEIFGYASGREAADYIEARMKESDVPRKLRIVRYPLPQATADHVIQTNQWHAREQLRFTDGTYTPLPFAEEVWFKERHEQLQHYAHVSVEDGAMVAFTSDSAYGENNRKVRLTVSTYLSRYYGSGLATLPSIVSEIVKADQATKILIVPLAHYSHMFNKLYQPKVEVQFAATQDEMEDVYTNGPDSCMSHKVSNYATDGVHPVTVYAAGDLQLAYIEINNRITARALVWPEKLAVGRIYGDANLLTCGLEHLGYNVDQSKWGVSLNGARLLKIHAPSSGYVMPYIDGSCAYHQHPTDRKFFAIGEGSGGGAAGYVTGLDNEDENNFTCERCDDRCDDDEAYSVIINTSGDTALWCTRCYGNNTFECAETSNVYSDQVNSIELHNGLTVAGCNSDNYFECALTPGWYHINDIAGSYSDSEDLISEAAITEFDLVFCHEKNYYIKRSDMPVATNTEDQIKMEVVA